MKENGKALVRRYAVWAEMLGGFAVLVTLVVLIYEVRESTRATQAQTVLTLSDQLMNTNASVTGNERSRRLYGQLLATGYLGFDDSEIVGADNAFRRFMYVYDNAVYQYNKGTLDEDFFHGLGT